VILLMMRIGIVAPSSAVGQVELATGAAHLRSAGLEVVVHPQCSGLHYTFAGADADRAKAVYDLATDPSIDVVWAAGGGYGATRLLPLLDDLSEEFGNPRHKLLVGYSDITVLHEYVRSRWNWSSLHFPMPSAASFPAIEPTHFEAAVQLVHGRKPADPWNSRPLVFLSSAPTTPLRGVMVGGNLSLYAALTGTPYAPIASPGRIIFLEDIDEAPYRIDRMATQLLQNGLFHGSIAIVLGDFTNCRDEPAQVLAPDGSGKAPLRPKIDVTAALRETFGSIGQRLGVPVAMGLPVGHGPNFAPLPLGAEYTLTPGGTLHLERWSWLGGKDQR
jgi:muramoyltetrapeptide carboxypeptidase